MKLSELSLHAFALGALCRVDIVEAHQSFSWLKPEFFFLAGVLKLVVVVSIFLLAVFLVFQLLEINIDFNVGNIFGK